MVSFAVCGGVRGGRHGADAGEVWAEYLTVVLTRWRLPWEVYELMRKVRLVTRWGCWLINVVVLVYLLWVLKKKRELRARATAGMVKG